ncbi:MAG: GGDEF domain-containing protein [Deinococcota bacterium]
MSDAIQTSSHNDQNMSSQSEFLHQSFLALTVVSYSLMMPFAINHFMRGRLSLGIALFLFLLVFAVNSWSILRRKHYYVNLTLFGLVPITIGALALSLNTQGAIGVLWCYPAVFSFYFILPKRRAWFANVIMLAVTLPTAWQVVERSLAIRMVSTLFMVSVFSAILIWIIDKQQQKLQLQAITDPLTGLYNRRLLHDSLNQAVAQSQRKQFPMTLLTLDIDHFKCINDTFGHAVGDEVLVAIAQILQSRVRLTDSAFRMGGEEFLILLFDTSKDEGLTIAEDLRQEVEALELLPDCKVTISTGIASLRPEETWAQWLKRGDKRLYAAKTGGRNQVVA